MSQNRVLVFIAHYGSSPLREKAMSLCLEHLARQSIIPDVVIGNLYFEDAEQLIIPKYPFVHEVPVKKSRKYEGLFHKEAMFNYLVRNTDLKDNDTLIFLDADVYSTDLDWLKKIALACSSNPETIYHGFSEVTDTVEENFYFNSVISAIHKTGMTDGTNPGLSWAMSSKLIKTLGRDVFFPEYICGAGDTAFYLNYARNIPRELMSLNRFSRYLYDLDSKFRSNTYEFDYVNVPIVHICHSLGKKNLAYYSLRSFAFDYFLKMTGDKSLFDSCILQDTDGFFYFSDSPENHKFQEFLKHIGTFINLDSLSEGMATYFSDKKAPKVTVFLSDSDSHTYIGVWKRWDVFYSSISQNFFRSLGMIHSLEEAEYVLMLTPDIILDFNLRECLKELDTSDFLVLKADIIKTAAHPFLEQRDSPVSLASMPGAVLLKKETYLKYNHLFDAYFLNKDRDFGKFLESLPLELKSLEVNKCGFIVFQS